MCDIVLIDVKKKCWDCGSMFPADSKRRYCDCPSHGFLYIQGIYQQGINKNAEMCEGT